MLCLKSMALTLSRFLLIYSVVSAFAACLTSTVPPFVLSLSPLSDNIFLRVKSWVFPNLGIAIFLPLKSFKSLITTPFLDTKISL